MNADGLRDELQAIMQGSITTGNGVDRVMAVLQRHIDAAREQVAEEIAAALAAVPDEVYSEDLFAPVTSHQALKALGALQDAGLPTLDRFSANAMRHAYRRAARIAREHAKGDSDE